MVNLAKATFTSVERIRNLLFMNRKLSHSTVVVQNNHLWECQLLSFVLTKVHNWPWPECSTELLLDLVPKAANKYKAMSTKVILLYQMVGCFWKTQNSVPVTNYKEQNKENYYYFFLSALLIDKKNTLKVHTLF